MHLSISSQHIADMIEFARAAHPHECCGLLFGEMGMVQGIERARNIARNPARHFEIDPAALFAAQKSARAGGPKLIGYFHSHPGGPAQPSQTDADRAAGDGRYWLIIAGQRVTAWAAVASSQDNSGQQNLLHGRFLPVALDQAVLDLTALDGGLKPHFNG